MPCVIVDGDDNGDDYGNNDDDSDNEDDYGNNEDSGNNGCESKVSGKMMRIWSW